MLLKPFEVSNIIFEPSDNHLWGLKRVSDEDVAMLKNFEKIVKEKYSDRVFNVDGNYKVSVGSFNSVREAINFCMYQLAASNKFLIIKTFSNRFGYSRMSFKLLDTI